MNAFVLSYNAAGNIVDTLPVSGLSNVVPFSFDIDATNNMIVGGSYLQPPSDLVSVAPRGQDGFLTRFAQKNQGTYLLPSTLPAASNGFQKIITNSDTSSANINVYYYDVATQWVYTTWPINPGASLRFVWNNQQWAKL